MNFKFSYLLLFCLFLLGSCQQKTSGDREYIRNTGRIYGTFYNIVYVHPEGKDLHELIKMRMQEFDNSLSTFNPTSVISRINKNDVTVTTDEYFNAMFSEAMRVSEITNGAFDITVAPLVNAWGFGFGEKDLTDIPDVKPILEYVGFRKIQLIDNKLIKEDPRIMLDASAIAKGQSVDVIARLLEDHGCVHFMVEIGGEVVAKGINPRGTKWKIGIDKPIDDPANEHQELQTILSISGNALATSGNYRRFYIRDGLKYAHTINPRTGYPVGHNLLSATVIAPTVMQADAFATAFMVLGVDSSLIITNQHPEMECYLIFSNDKGEFEVVYSDGFAKFLNE